MTLSDVDYKPWRNEAQVIAVTWVRLRTFSVFGAMSYFLGDKCTHVFCQKFADHVTKTRVKRINTVL